MSYHLVIEGSEGTRTIREGFIPKRGEWISLKFEGALWWLPVLEVGHALSRPMSEGETGAPEAIHERAEPIVITSLALGVRTDPREDDAYKQVLPPPRWPFGGRPGSEDEGNDKAAWKKE